MMVRIKRKVAGKERYYMLSLSENLFGQFIIERVFGSCSNSKPTREMREFFCDIDIANKYYSKLLNSKLKKGYFIA